MKVQGQNMMILKFFFQVSFKLNKLYKFIQDVKAKLKNFDRDIIKKDVISWT